MFGLNNSSNQLNNQIPYEVYETVHQPAARRRRWLIRLGASLVVVTLLVFAGTQIKHAFTDDDKKGGTTQSQSSDGPDSVGASSQNNAEPIEAVVQQPQQNTPLPTVSTEGQPANDTQNNATVRKPE